MARASWVVALMLGVGAPVVGWLLQSVSAQLALALTVLGSGASLALLLIPEMSVLLWAGTSVIFGSAVLLLHALARAFIPALAATPFLTCVAILAGLLGLVAALALWRARWPREICAFTRGDVAFLVLFLPIAASTLLVASRNGYAIGHDGREEFHARGFVNGDTFTLFALVHAFNPRGQPQGLTPGVRGVEVRNPFAAGTKLEYPSLIHRALDEASPFAGVDFTRQVWWRILGILAGTVAVSVLSVKYLFRGQTVPLWAGVVGLLAFATTWESFTYPQSHTFVTGLFLLLVLLSVLLDQSRSAAERAALGITAGALAVLLLFSNAVLGTAAIALLVVAKGLRLFDVSRPRSERAVAVLGGILLLVLFVLFPPGAGALGTLNVAYTAMPQFLVAALPALLMGWAIREYRFLHGSPALLGAAVVLPGLAFVSLFLSARDIVAENSPRFLFLLVLLGWPLLIPLVQRVADWWWREVKHVEHTVVEYLALWGGGVAVLLLLLLPSFASVAGTLDHLVRQPPKIVSADELAAFAWIRENTPPDAVFLRAPESVFDYPQVAPLSLPAFTGRAQLRSEYWLSPDDEVLAGLRAVFSGDPRRPAEADYLFCGPEITRCPERGRFVARFGSVTVQMLGR